MQEVAELIGVVRSAYAAYESGRNYPKLDTMFALSNHFGVTIDDMVGKDLNDPVYQAGNIETDKPGAMGELVSVLSRLNSELNETEKKVLKALTPEGRVALEGYLEELIKRHPEEAQRLGLVD